MSRQLTKQLLLSSNYWVLNKTVVKIFGLETAFLLSNFAEAETMMSDKEGWFYQTSDTVEEMTTLSRHKQDQCIKELEDKGILKKDLRGMPAKRYFKINYECLTNLIVNSQQTSMRNIDKQDCKKSATNKESSYKENNINKVYKESTKSSAEPYEEIKNLFHDICISYSKIRTISNERKKHIKARYKQYDNDLEVFKELFTLAEESKFLKGENNRNWKANFDWLMNENNMAKVLEGRYINEQSSSVTGKQSTDDEKFTEEDARRAGVTIL